MLCTMFKCIYKAPNKVKWSRPHTKSWVLVSETFLHYTLPSTKYLVIAAKAGREVTSVWGRICLGIDSQGHTNWRYRWVRDVSETEEATCWEEGPVWEFSRNQHQWERVTMKQLSVSLWLGGLAGCSSKAKCQFDMVGKAFWYTFAVIFSAP